MKGTHKDVLNRIEHWAEDSNEPPVYWLNGLAGTGKSTLAQTIAEQLFADGHLGASFFCSRDVADRSNLQLIFPTLAFQLAQRFPTFQSSLVPLLKSNPDIVYESLQAQMQSLIIEPLSSTGISTVIVVDALDECGGEYPQSAFLHVLGESVSKLHGVKFFIASRPEKEIVSGFSDLQKHKKIFVLHTVDRYTVDSDICLYFKHELSKLAPRCGGIKDWPTNEQLTSLCQRAAGFFVYAAATVKFLDHKFRRPSDQLNVIMKSPESTAHEGRVELKPYASLDSLYLSIFKGAFGKCTAEDHEMIQSVLCAVIHAINPLSPSTISILLDLEHDVVQSILESIQSLLLLHEDPNQPIQPFHKSFPDFITDPTRCTDTRFCIPLHDQTLGFYCIKLMVESPQKNGWLIPDDLSDPRVGELEEMIWGSDICGVLEHAYMSWHHYLITTKNPTADVLSVLAHFFEQKFLFWTMMICTPFTMQNAVHALKVTAVWLKRVCSS